MYILTNISGVLRNIFTAFRGLDSGDKTLQIGSNIGLGYGYYTKVFEFLHVLRNQLLVIQAADLVRIITNTTVVLQAVIVQNSNAAYFLGMNVNVAGTGSSVTVRDIAGNTLLVIPTTAVGVVSLPAGIPCYDVVTAGTAAADVSVIYIDGSSTFPTTPLE